MVTIQIDGKAHKSDQGDSSWRTVRELGAGGQGNVFDAVRFDPARTDKVRSLLDQLSKAFTSSLGNNKDQVASRIGNLIDDLNSPPPGVPIEHVLKTYRPREGQAPKIAQVRATTEVVTLGRLCHANIIRVVDHGETDSGLVWIVFPKFQRGTLSANANRFTGSPARSLTAVSQILSGLHELHSNKIAHRDLKPDNIFLTDDGTCVIGDFGLLLDLESPSRLTASREDVGAWEIRPPWSAHDKDARDDPRVDLYAVGKILWCLIAGEQNLEREFWNTPDNDLTNRVEGDPLIPGVNSILSKVVVDRVDDVGYSSAGEMLREVERVRSGIPDPSHTPTEHPHRCLSCHSGEYRKVQEREGVTLGWMNGLADAIARPKGRLAQPAVAAFEFVRCNSCGHLMFYARTKK